MAATDSLLKPGECVLLLVDFQAGLGFGVESSSRQVLLNNAVALARTAAAFNVPVVVSTSASRVYSGPLLPALQDALPSVKAIERKNMNVGEDDTARNAVAVGVSARLDATRNLRSDTRHRRRERRRLWDGTRVCARNDSSRVKTHVAGLSMTLSSVASVRALREHVVADDG